MSTLTTPIDSNSRKSWTVLIYMVADGPSGSQALDEIALREISSIIHGIKATSMATDRWTALTWRCRLT
jgi:hypothetical protein